jgi:two-component system, NtrC family, nitrogen regulation response regulator NtrX
VTGHPAGDGNGLTTLIVDDDPFVRESLREILEHAGYVALEAGDGKTALELLDQEHIDLLLLDLELPRVSGMNVLREVADRHLDVPVVIISGKGSIPKAVSTIKLGAFDFIEKPLDAQRTLHTVGHALSQAVRQRTRRRSLAEAMTRYRMCGASEAMQSVYESIERAATSRAKVLLIGESGTGKEMVAHAIHRQSKRSRGPFVAVNCAAIPESLIESELFGHEAGAFTDARGTRKGKFEQAHEGTLFLDEVGDMSLMTQAKVLRALEEMQIERVGGQRPIRLDVRVIAATNRDLLHEVEEGNFREDLYYRLSVITIRVPPLRERREDVGALVEFFIQRHSADNACSPKTVTPAASALLLEHHWPGNVRELSNTIERIIVLNERPVIGAQEVRQALARPPASTDPGEMASLRDAREQFERDYIRATLSTHEGRIKETAESLGINRSHLWKKMRHLGIQ